jgi:hypothetical protein
MSMTSADEARYIIGIAVALRALAKVEKTMTYGDLAKVIGLWDGVGAFRHFHTIDRLINKTNAVYRDEALEWKHLVNAKTGKPGRGFYYDPVSA